MKLRLATLVIVVLALGACALPATTAPTPTLAPTSTAVPTIAPARPTATPVTLTLVPSATPERQEASYEEADCRFEPPSNVTVACGYLVVPERRDRPTERMIRLHVAVFKSTATQPAPDPVVYLDGGPGGETLKITPFVFEDRYAPLLRERDLIVYDQRGAGFSEPSLDCPELTELDFELLDDNLTAAELNRRYVEVSLACRDRLVGEGIDLSAYTSIESAADLDDLRQALGYETWNLYGISYGTRLALTAMRDHPQGIRSVVIDSVLPLTWDVTEIPAGADRAFQRLFDGCAADEACNRAYPHLRETFARLVAELNAEPAMVRVTNPLSGERQTVLLNGAVVVDTLFLALYSSSTIPSLPFMITAARGGNHEPLAQEAMFGALQGEFISEGMYYSVWCNEEVPFSTQAELAAADDPFPEQVGVFDMAPFGEICAAWGAGQAAAVEDQPVISNIPTLVFAGEYDPITPPAYGRIAAQTLPNSFFFEFPGMSHGVSASGGCAQGMMREFLANPARSPDAACIAQMRGPRFEMR